METSTRKTVVYLASPYSHRDSRIRQLRFEQVCVKAAELMDAGFIVFCPIAHTHPLTEYTNILQNKTPDFWLEQDFEFLDYCDELWVYMLEGWHESYGVGEEIKRAKLKNKRIVYVSDIPYPFLEDPECLKPNYSNTFT